MSNLLSGVQSISEDEKLKKPLTTWKKQPAYTPNQVQSQNDASISASGNTTSAQLQFLLSEECTNKLTEICGQYKVSLPVVLLAAFKTLIYRHTHQTELVTGYSDCSYKSGNDEVAELLKKFQPVQINLSANLLFVDLLQQIQQVVDTITDYQQKSHFSPKAIFVYTTKAGFELRKNNAFQNNYTIANGQDKAELQLTLMSAGYGIEGLMEYNEELFDEAYIVRMIEHYQVLIGEIIQDPAQKIAQILILKEAERYKLLVEWNNTKADYPSDKCIHELFEEQVKMNPQAVAVVLHPRVRKALYKSGRQLTYAELDKKANQTAQYLQSLGVGPDVVVGIFMNRSLEMVIALLAILKAGGAYLPMDPAHPRERLDFVLKDSGITLLLSQYYLMNKLPVVEKRVVYLDEELDKISYYNSDKPVTQARPENLAYVIYTSGSTGLPKGTLIPHKSAVNYITWCIQAYSLHKGDGAPVNSSLGFDATVTSFLSPLLTGKKVMLLPEDGEIEALVDVLQSKSKFSLIKITPAHLEILSNLLTGKNFLQQTNAFVIGGEALKGKSLAFWRKPDSTIRLINEYGPTETTVGCCIYEVSADEVFTEDVPIGRPIANTQMYILDSYMQPVPIGVAGEIYIGGAGLARGYLNRPELTAERFVPNPFSTIPGERLYKTGDLARYLPDGNITFLGRKDNQVKIRGYRIELGEIEHAIQDTGLVSQAVVLARENQDGDKLLVGYYVPHPTIVQSKERELQTQRIANWKSLYETEYAQTEEDKNINSEFNIVGWNDSFTGELIPASEMKLWVDDTLQLVLNGNPENVLEIDCGTGLMYYQLAGKIGKYIGSDISKSAISQIKERIEKKSRDYGDTELFTAPAHEVQLAPGQKVDTILLSAKIHYFPGKEYLDLVMDNCIGMMGEKGRIILSDVRDNRLLPLFKARLRLQKSGDAIPVKEFQSGLEQDILNEDKLYISPSYFYKLQKKYPQITHVEIRWKQGSYINELTLYRYTVILYVGIKKQHVLPDWQSWKDFAGNHNILKQNDQPVIAVQDVPNPRLRKERVLHQILKDSSFKTTAGFTDVIETEDDETSLIEGLVNDAASLGYQTKFLLHPDPFLMNVVFRKDAAEVFIQLPADNEWGKTKPKTNIPLFADIALIIQKEIQQSLSNRLPKYMVPSALIAYRQLPVNINGKIDHTALLVPTKLRQDSQKKYVAGRNELEIELTKLFEKCMGINKISVQDDVFELGLNSMQAYRLFAQIKKITGIQLPLSILIQTPTIEKLAVYLNGKEAALPWSCIVPIQTEGSNPPLYLIHAGAGTVLFYHELSKRLGTDQPVYGIQPKGIDGKQNFHSNVEEMAQHYINEILHINPTGPYLLGGYCFGAVIAFEMAQQLTNQGFTVALLASFNGVSPMYNYSLDAGINHTDDEDLKIHPDLYEGFTWKNFAKKSTKEKFRYLSKKINNRVANRVRGKVLYGSIALLILAYKLSAKLKIKSPEVVRKYYLFFNNGNMVNAYKPKPYSGVLTVFRSPNLYGDPYLGWREFVTGEINIYDISGYHTNRRQIMNEPFVEFTAGELEKCINKSLQI